MPMHLPTIDLVQKLPQDPTLPAGFDSSPYGPGGLVHLLGVESVRAFALSYRWDTADIRKSARGWAAHVPHGYATAATIRAFLSSLTADQKKSINYSCNFANDLPGGGQTYAPVAFDASTTPVTSIIGGAFPADFLQGQAGNDGATRIEKGPMDALQLAFASLIHDIRLGAYLLPSAVA